MSDNTKINNEKLDRIFELLAIRTQWVGTLSYLLKLKENENSNLVTIKFGNYTPKIPFKSFVKIARKQLKIIDKQLDDLNFQPEPLPKKENGW